MPQKFNVSFCSTPWFSHTGLHGFLQAFGQAPYSQHIWERTVTFWKLWKCLFFSIFLTWSWLQLLEGCPCLSFPAFFPCCFTSELLSLSQQLIELRHFLCSPEPLNQFQLPTKVSLLSLLFSVSFQPAASFWYIFSLQIKGFHFTEVFGLGYFCRICKCTCVHWQYNSVPSYAQFPEESQNYLPLSGFLHQMFPKDVILGLGWRFSPIVFPVLKLHTPYYSILFLPQKGISAYCLVYHAAFSWLFCKKCES